MPCPECGAENRLCVKNGKVYRKTAAGADRTCGAKVQRYVCTICGKMGRGNLFKLPEFDGEPIEPLDQPVNNNEKNQ